MALAPQFDYQADPLEADHGLNVTSRIENETDTGATFIATYDNGLNASAITAHHTVTIVYSNISWTIDESTNYITVTGDVSDCSIVQTSTSIYDRYERRITIQFMGSEVANFTYYSNNDYTWNIDLPNTFSVTIPPATTTSLSALDYINRTVEYPNNYDRATLGLHITNPNPADYRPGALLSNGTWYSHNRDGKAAHIRSGSSWNEMRTLNGGSGTDNAPLIYTSSASTMYNMKRIGNS